MPKVAIAHDYLTQRGGAERVTVNLLEAFEGAPLYTSLYNPETTFPELGNAKIYLSPLNRVGFFRRNFRAALPLFGWAFDRLKVAEQTQAVVVSTTGFAHGIKSQGRKVVYCHSPARFLYLTEEYLGAAWWRKPTGWALMALRPLLLHWDRKAASSADIYLCNSTVVRKRIKQVYGIDAQVVHPPAALDPSLPQSPVAELADWPNYHLLVSRLLPYKNVHQVIKAFAQLPQERLLVVGSGPERDRLAAQLPPNVKLVEGLTDAQLCRAYAGAKAVIAASFEDFGLTPVEGFNFGVPCLALRAGGYLDTVIDGTSGYFFDRPTPDQIVAAVEKLQQAPLPKEAILSHAQRFSKQRFAAELNRIVDQVLAEEAARCSQQ